MFKCFFIGIEFGMVTAAVQGKVDCVDYVSHWIVLSCFCGTALASLFLLLRTGLFCQPALDGECFAQRGLPTRGELFGDFGIRHEEIESVESAAHDQEFGCDS